MIERNLRGLGLVQRNGQAGVIRITRENGVQSATDQLAMTKGWVFGCIVTLDR